MTRTLTLLALVIVSMLPSSQSGYWFEQQISTLAGHLNKDSNLVVSTVS